MKIGLIGNYGHRNLGDEALLSGAIISAIEMANLAPDNIVVISDDAEDTMRRFGQSGIDVRQFKRLLQGRLLRLPLVLADIFRALRGLDWVVFGGGGLLNDSNRTAVPLFAITCLLARLRGARIAWWSIGIGPLHGRMHRRLARRVLASSDFVTVRDQASADIGFDLLGKSPPIAPDLAHALDMPTSVAADDCVVAVSVIPYQKPGSWFAADEKHYAEYCAKMVALVQSLLAYRDDLIVRLFPVSLDQDRSAIDDILALGALSPGSRIEVTKPESPSDLLEGFKGVSVVVATRLHSAVLATVSGVPLVTIAYQPKVESYTKELAIDTPCFGIDTFAADAVVDSVVAVLEKGEQVGGRIRATNTERRESIREALKVWRSLL